MSTPNEKEPRALIVTAHPDDAILSMGGTILSLAANGVSMVHLSLTSGEQGGSPTQRRNELTEIFQRLVEPKLKHGATIELLFGNMADGGIPGDGSSVTSLLDLLGDRTFDVAFLHCPSDDHIDHVNACRIGRRLARKTDSVLYFNSWRSLTFNNQIRIDVTDVWKERSAMIDFFKAHPQTAALKKICLRAELNGTYLRRGDEVQIFAESFDVERLNAATLARLLGD